MINNETNNPCSSMSYNNRIPVSNVVERDKTDYDRVLEQIGLVDLELEHFINGLKSKDANIQFQDPGCPEFNQSLYDEDLKQTQDKRETAARWVCESTNSTEASVARDRFYAIKDPDKNDPKYMIPTTITNVCNVKDAYKRLLSLKDKWDDAIHIKENELKSKKRQSYKIDNYKLLKDDGCFEAIVAIIKHPCVVRDDERINYRFDSNIISELESVRDRNPAVFDECKTISEYHKRVDDGMFDPISVYISNEDKEKLAHQFVSNNWLLDSRSIECIKMKRDHYNDMTATEAIKAEFKMMLS